MLLFLVRLDKRNRVLKYAKVIISIKYYVSLTNGFYRISHFKQGSKIRGVSDTS